MPPAQPQPENPEISPSQALDSLADAPSPVPREKTAATLGDQAAPPTIDPALLPQPIQSNPSSSTPPVRGISGPGVAEDVDVIEKEWVDKAEKVIDQTKTDPYVEEEAVEDLQIDYLKKRYGHDVKKPDQQK